MTAVGDFARDYAEARQMFRASAKAVGARLKTYKNPNVAGPKGEELTTDVALLGKPDAGRVLYTQSATHGVEGFCGSGCQVGWLRSGAAASLPEDVAVAMVHAINPYGFAWLRRVTEDNVDLNRNCIDHNGERPQNPDYAPLHAHLVPESWSAETLAKADAALVAYRETHGAAQFQIAVSSGQYDHADGLFFGGVAPTWSNLTMRQIVGEHLGKARHVASVDFHTGLGPYAYGEPIAPYLPDSREYKEAVGWYGDSVASPFAGNSTSVHGVRMKGSIHDAIRDSAPQARHLHIAIEYGTMPSDYVMRSLRADNWLHLRGDPQSQQGREIKAMIRNAFYRDEDDWKELVSLRAQLLMGRAIKGLQRAQ
ncbi:MAG: DUF2817 domain-containing protein [Proteobacteria bacterium]|nr:DUF2817 domain-containing protein [Pseudomonadota bacterium]MBI3499169.1 DUF2817 domain-containing protein [Pseudomonadota bacterium]